MSAHAAAHRRSIEEPDAFWMEAAGSIDWVVRPTRALGDHPAGWFADGTMSTAFNALDRHVLAGHGDRLALVHDSPVTGTVSRRTYRELRDEVALAAGALRALGVERGDRVLLYVPMVPEAVVAMLACARLGAVHTVVFGGFAPQELAARIDDAEPTVVVTASCGIEAQRIHDYKALLDAALELSTHQPRWSVVLQRPQAPAVLGPRDVAWADVLRDAEPAECVVVDATDPLYVLYTSGTTGKPKGVVRDHGGHAVALAWSMRHVYAIGPGDVFWAASDVGWVVGHSYIVYAPLLVGATSVLYEGKPVGTPDASAFWRVVADHDVNVLFTAPTAIRAIRREDPDGALLRAHERGSLRALFLAGERTDAETHRWATAQLGVPVVDHWWQTETGWPIAANCLGIEPLAVKAGSPTKPVPGFDVHVLDPSGARLPNGVEGAIVIARPLPPGCLTSLWRDDERCDASYFAAFPGYYLTGDSGFFDEDGYLFVMGRADDVINVAGHRLSSGAIEQAVACHPGVAECAVIGVADELKGQVPAAFVVRAAGANAGEDQDLRVAVIALVRERVGSIATPGAVHLVDRLPKTRSGKVVRATMRKIAAGESYVVPATIEDPEVLTELAALFPAA